MASGLEDLGFIESGLEDLGFTPIQESKQQIIQQRPQNWLQKQQNTLIGGLITGAANSVLGIPRMAEQFVRGGSVLLNRSTGLDKILGVPSLEQSFTPNIPRPEEPTSSYHTGEFIGEWGPTIYGGGKLLSSAIKKGAPIIGKYAGNILGDLKSGIRPGRTAATLQELSSENASNIVKAPSEALYNKAFNLSGKHGIYEPDYQHGSHSLQNLTETLKRKELPNSKLKYVDLNPLETKNSYKGAELKRLHNKFEENPTLKRAHKLQSQLGTEIRKIESKGNLADAADEIYKTNYEYARDLLKNDINSFLDKSKKGLSEAYKEATKLHAKNVVPHERAASIVRSKINEYTNKINPKNLSRALETAYTGSEEGINNIPEKFMSLNELMKKQIKNKKLASTIAKHAVGYGIGGTLLSHLFAERR